VTLSINYTQYANTIWRGPYAGCYIVFIVPLNVMLNVQGRNKISWTVGGVN
jgi:hypothetical protein